MRPGQLTPENPELVTATPVRLPGFNEAGAINPGKLDGQKHLRLVGARASMRPGQLTPENEPGFVPHRDYQQPLQ